MKKIINKKNLFYTVAILHFIYLSFLINRLHQNRLLAQGFILFLCVAIGVFCVYRWQKNKDINIIQKKKKKVILGSILSALFVLIVGFPFFCAQYKPTEIALEMAPTDFKFIDEIQIDQVSYKYNGDCFSGEHEPYCTNKVKLTVGAIVGETQSYKFDFEKASSIKIVFNEKANDLIVKEEDKVLTVGDLSHEYVVSSNQDYNFYSLIYSLLSLEFMAFVFFLLFTYFISVKDNYKKMFMAVLVISFVIFLFYFCHSQLGYQCPDSIGYIGFNFSSFFHLVFDDRVPLYPVLIRICRHLFVDNYLIWVCIFQYAFHFISILYFYRLIYLLTKNEKVAGLSSILYALMPSIAGWDNVILTESIALSGTIVFIYYIIDYIKNHQLRSGLLAVIIALLLTFVRPTSLILVVALLGFFLLRFLLERKEFRNDLKCFIGSVLSFVVIVIYAFIFHRTFGIYSLTNALVRQDLFVNVQEGYYASSSNQAFIDTVNESLEKLPDRSYVWDVLGDVFAKFSQEEVAALNKECRNKNLLPYTKYLYRLAKENASISFSSYGNYYFPSVSIVNQYSLQETFSGITFLSSYIAIILEGVVTLYLWIKNKKVPWVDLGLFGFPLVIILSSYIGTCAEFMRTAICTVPFTFIAYIFLITRFLKLERK